MFLVTVIEDIPYGQLRKIINPKDSNIKNEKELIESNIEINAALQRLSDRLGKNTNKDNMHRFVCLLFESYLCTCVINYGGKYVNLSPCGDYIIKPDQIIMERRFSDYYKEGQYDFINQNGRIVIDVESVQPINKYENDVRQMLNLN